MFLAREAASEVLFLSSEPLAKYREECSLAEIACSTRTICRSRDLMERFWPVDASATPRGVKPIARHPTQAHSAFKPVITTPRERANQSVARSTDPEGRRVVLADAVWREKIVRDHPEIDTHMSDVLRAVTRPDHVAADPIFDARSRYYARGVGPSRWLLVVVSYEQVPARIVSAFANRKDPKSWSA